MIQGQNVRKLIIAKMARDAVPDSGGFEDAIKFFTSGRIADAAGEAEAWVAAQLAEVKACANSPYGDDDEAIAGEILRQIESRKKESR